MDQVSGDLGVTWYDTRNSGAGNDTTQVYGTVSLDGGATWLANVQISAGTSNASAVDNSPVAGFDYGDYDLMDFSNGVLYRTWADNSNSTADNPNGTAALDIYTARVTVPVIAVSADLGVSVSGPTKHISEGENIRWTITVTNTGPDPAQKVVVSDMLDPNLIFVSAKTSQGTFTQSGGDVSFSFGTVGAGQSVTATVTAMSTEDGSLTNTASVKSSTGDPNTSNNTATSTTTVVEPPVCVSAPITVKFKKTNTVTVATFAHANGVEPVSAFSATIDWGDGTSSSGSITQSGATYTVKGTHTYANSRSHTVTTTVKEVGTSPNLLGASGGLTSPIGSAALAAPTTATTADIHAAAVNALLSEGSSSGHSVLSDQEATNLVVMSRAGITDPGDRCFTNHKKRS